MEEGLGDTALLQGRRPPLHPLASPGVHSEDEDDDDDIRRASEVEKSTQECGEEDGRITSAVPPWDLSCPLSAEPMEGGEGNF